MGRFNLEYDIPTYRIVEIYKSGATEPLIGSPLIMDEDFSIQCSSKFGELWQASPNNFMNLLSSSFGLPSGQFSLQGVQIWQSTDPLSINVNVKLEMDKDPFIDVIDPTLTLMQSCLPEEDTIVQFSDGAYLKVLRNLKISTLIPPGPNVQAILKESSDGTFEGKSNGVFDIRIGFVKIPSVIITKVEPTFSKVYAESPSKVNKLYPSSVELSIDVSTMKIATTNMLSSMLSSV